ncbi:MAG: transcription elongation factor GreA [[Lactobacillus] timonensis]|uniref:transcription elongation factor GreA n=1 Tax=[Lactobacillus] timonensis TaxID=1970790 RepID=UPI002357B46D|nr:transcription elongation factor GreA [[Lactobacillus] timonensis]MCI1287070.1 transcription elongation factor GreA [[Lactobacillus] timonensis]MCI1925454.1 transcription elongation factor GreA [[Lactobacillus] timonensis]MCI1956794.1 transcription elongation factor GreA [[Lactobacillus] timonensis]MCI1969784.1 transcription elongation factor GreA [[Lactobacillus] timonensis]MCI2006003.1 transcription elongation factor GreA [[Lactobacillus] timonensis]
MNEIYWQQMTPQGYQEIQQQIAELQDQRPAKIAQLKAARALGDLSENTEYSTAKRELRHLESRLRYLNKLLTYAKVVTPANNGKVGLGSTVTLEFTDDHSQVSYQLVGKQQADVNRHLLSFDSPLGKALMHQPAGTTVSVTAPAGNYQVKILSIQTH